MSSRERSSVACAKRTQEPKTAYKRVEVGGASRLVQVNRGFMSSRERSLPKTAYKRVEVGRFGASRLDLFSRRKNDQPTTLGGGQLASRDGDG